jgi:DNA-binding transcriptional regulator YdaS (Cro superfamily)
MNLNEWLKQERGRQAELARHLGIKPPQVADWISHDKPVPVVHMAAIEAYTAGAVTRREMRPDDWQRIWPELGRSSNIQSAAAGEGV